MNVPFVDLRAQHDELRSEIEASLRHAIDESAFVGGPAVSAFEQAFAKFCGSRSAVATASGTDALELALRAVGVVPGDVVVTAVNTFIATAEAAIQLGASPRFIDIDPATYNIDVVLLDAYLTQKCERDADGVLRESASGKRVAAVLPVHLYGLPADLAPIVATASALGVDVVEDACQAHGAAYRFSDGVWRMAGAIGRVGCFSFYPGKNLGAMGEAGAIVTDDPVVDERVRIFRDHGQSERYIHDSPNGVNGRMDAIQAAILSVKLHRLQDWNERRRQIAGWYHQELSDLGVPLPVEPAGTRHVYHLYVIRVPNRDQVRAILAERGIVTGLHYPVPLHLQPAYRELGLEVGAFPVAEAAAAEILPLEMYPHLTREQVAYVAESLRCAIC